MKGSYLARWAAPSTAGLPNYEIQYPVDERFDANGALHGDFINIAAVVDGDYVYLFGTGAYRASPVHLARKRLDTLASAGGFERYDAPIVADANIGELSVRYYAAIDRWVMLDQESVERPQRHRRALRRRARGAVERARRGRRHGRSGVRRHLLLRQRRLRRRAALQL